ncbi:cytochrome b561 and DOMON domain-containing protein At2g04850 isoform X1 [Dioscorea cayenensis subsp. rotundata]|uniref:Cytochrome b561 and DOMON domain-containing protein n=1 Tax=Dioscorea cayennensis subsp. rotundata TaxID=55577 RepID=A0AB40AVE6_DIOCR|nr:cytochrome b561 and DOMON domain-containing protein At2g04850 isoform X1 [Dioscorea cayenensis subsp. rotundata]
MLHLLLLLLLHSPLTTSSHCSTSTTLKTYQKCMSLPSQDATLAWTYYPHNSTLDLSFTSSFLSPSGWVAWGLNPTSPQMSGTRSLIAFSDPSSGSLILLPFILSPSTKLQLSPLLSTPLDIPLLSSSALLRHDSASIRAGAVVEIHATLKLVPNRTRINHVWNRGLYVQGYSPTIHPLTSSDLASRATIDVVSTAATLSPELPSWAKPLHGVLNALSWGFLLPAGVVIARYVRQFESAGPTWFYAHAAVQATGYILGITGFAIGIAMGNSSPGVTYSLHRGLGVAVVVAGGLQSLALFFRPSATHRFRKYWKSYHHFVGYGCVVLGVVNVFQGMEIMGLGRSYGKLGYCMVLSTLLGVCVALEVNAWVVFCRKAKEEKMRRESGGNGFQHVRKGSF